VKVSDRKGERNELLRFTSLHFEVSDSFDLK
jgi:hypothetical protein